ncbi:ester cyclase [Pseudoxanthomonas winnipegensis]|uniref:Ester cyclase n=1 Tax=Pseudoxanthomonas winnipegensis TaxID=2480810 RepID=A0A4Q8L4B5_9GAMM|nr:ester cyclase [Pseudoxanthomonas winnipegensis]PZP59180.1 MAG: hypothetical protein DI597_17160 [Pseudoxanthomonas spadix]TAA20111.1 hypothetical protein EA660_18940 [Pseudoxanthomonas winnipegensis]
MRAIDVAWNVRDWNTYAGLLDDALVAHASGTAQPHDKARHVANAIAFCGAFPDARVVTTPYITLFAAEDGARTCSVARITGTADGDLTWLGDPAPVAAGRAFDTTFAAICHWRGGRVIGQRQYLDIDLMLRQLRGEPLTTHGAQAP